MTIHDVAFRRATVPPHPGGPTYLTDGGLETWMIFQAGRDLPLFAAFPMLDSAEGRAALASYYWRFLDIAAEAGVGFVLETPTWRASADWGARLGYDAAGLSRVNREAVAFLRTVRAGAKRVGSVAICGQIGPRGDGYDPAALMTAVEARTYHAPQIAAFAEMEADMAAALTMTHAGEATGIALAARAAGLPAAISFTVETDGRLPSGQPLGEAIEEVEHATDGAPAYYQINCAHPDHFRETLRRGGAWVERIGGLRANASRRSHAELDVAETLDDGDPLELGRDYAALRGLLPKLAVYGGCCGTDHRHVRAVAEACVFDADHPHLQMGA